jgi:hypothetical protein
VSGGQRLESYRYLRCGLRTLVEFGPDATPKDPAEMRVIGLVGQLLGLDALHSHPGEACAGTEFDEQEAEGEEIAPRTIAPFAEDFLWHVARGADDTAGASQGRVVNGTGQTQISESGFALVIEEDVLEFEVAMQDVVVVEVGEGPGQAGSDGGQALARDGPSLGQRGGHVPAGHPLEDEVGRDGVQVNIEDPDDSRVGV